MIKNVEETKIFGNLWEIRFSWYSSTNEWKHSQFLQYFMCNSKNLGLAYKFEVRGLREATLYKELVLKVIKQSDWLWTKKNYTFKIAC
jgi:hypothetical protein